MTIQWLSHFFSAESFWKTYLWTINTIYPWHIHWISAKKCWELPSQHFDPKFLGLGFDSFPGTRLTLGHLGHPLLDKLAGRSWWDLQEQKARCLNGVLAMTSPLSFPGVCYLPETFPQLGWKQCPREDSQIRTSSPKMDHHQKRPDTLFNINFV
jgi:hypothetical protein